MIYVAAQGPLWKAGGDRGLFKSADGGKTWQKILGGGDYTGVNEVRMDPRNPDVVYVVNTTTYRSTNGGQAFTASPVAAGTNIYFASEQGEVFVVAAAEWVAAKVRSREFRLG